MEKKNKLTVTRGAGEGGQWGKEGEGTSQRPRVNGTWAWTAV